MHKLLGGVLLTIVVVPSGPYVAVHFGLMADLADKAWLILLVTTAGLIVKTLVGDTVAGEFLFHKFGYDNCIMTFAGILTALALQLVASADLFPGLNTVAVLKDIRPFSADPVANRSIQLFLFLLLSLILTLMTSKISAGIKNKTVESPDLLSGFNTFAGTTLLALYVLVLVTKG